MTYITESMRAALAEHRLMQVCNANGVKVFRMGRPDAVAREVDLIFAARRIALYCDVLGPQFCLVSLAGYETPQWFAMAADEDYLCNAFHATRESGWLCAIQQRFAELYWEREARIEAIVAGWRWVEGDTIWALMTDIAGEMQAVVTAAGWAAGTETEACDSMKEAKDAARAAVLRQAKEQPGLWHCGAVDE